MKGERYSVGDRVIHDVFGMGTIVGKFLGKPRNYPVIIVQFDSLETKRNIVAGFYGIRKIK